MTTMTAKASVIRTANTLVWALLMIATAIGWRLGHAAQSVQGDVRFAMIGVVATAALKVWLVGYQFMELKTAPKALYYAFAAWLIAVSGALIFICL